MSEVQSRPATRGRSSARGGRGGYASRGPRPNSKQTNGDHYGSTRVDTSADQGELGELKRQYLSQLTTLKELFPDWADVDLLLALQETDGDLQSTIERITEGNVSQFSEVKKTKDRSRSKVKDAAATGPDVTSASTRASRGRGGHDSARGGRGRTERGRGGFRGTRGGAQASTNGTRAATGPVSVPTTESPAWDNTAASENHENARNPAWEQQQVAQTGEPKVQKSFAVPQAAAKKTWASIAKPAPAPAPPKPVTQTPVVPEERAPALIETLAHEEVLEVVAESEELPVPPVEDEIPEEIQAAPEELSSFTPENLLEEPGDELTPSKHELTEDNVEHLPDVSVPPPTETAASIVASSRDVGSVGSVGSVTTPLSSAPQAPIGRPAIGGYATTALKAAGTPHRSASFQRRLIEQQEAVVMPGNHAVDRAAVQFGSMGLNGDLDSDALDIDEDREEAETRTQPPQHSPVAQPRASLPPAPRQPAPPAEAPSQETHSTPKQAPGLPPVPQPQNIPAHQQSPQSQLGPQIMQQQGSQTGQQYGQFGRYGQGGIQSEPSAPAQKPYDPFGQQASQPTQFDNYSSQAQAQTQASSQPLQQPQSQTGAFSSAPNEYSYTSEQQRNAYNYYQNYNQQSATGQQEAGSTQQRTGSAFGTGPSDSSFPPTQPQQGPNRYGEAQNSGHTTPNPALGGQHPTGPPSQQAQHMHQQPHAQPGHAGAYPYNHPYYGSPYFQNYMNQYGNYGQQGYGAFSGKGMYGQPHHGYGISPQTSYDQHSSSPANVSGFGQSSMHGRDSTLGGALGDYGRSGSAQPSQNQQHSANAAGGFGGIPDVFARSQAGFPSQNQPYGQQQGAQQGASEDSLKPFGDSKTGAGPSPSALGQPGRPGSATNNAPGQSQTGLPPPQSHQQGFGGYPSHLNQLQGGQGNQYGGLGGLGGHQGGAQSHQTGGYGGYGGFGGYGSYNRGGWGTNYGQH